MAWRIMANMGYREGEGLGKYGQGIKEVDVRSAPKRLGLGYTPNGEPRRPLKWKLHEHFVRGEIVGNEEPSSSSQGSSSYEEAVGELEEDRFADVFDLTELFTIWAEASPFLDLIPWRPFDPHFDFTSPPRARAGIFLAGDLRAAVEFSLAPHLPQAVPGLPLSSQTVPKHLNQHPASFSASPSLTTPKKKTSISKWAGVRLRLRVAWLHG